MANEKEIELTSLKLKIKDLSLKIMPLEDERSKLIAEYQKLEEEIKK